MTQRYAIFVHDPDGDMGEGRIIGGIMSPDRAEIQADQIRRAGERQGREVECIILPLEPGSTSATAIAAAVLGDPFDPTGS